MASQDYKEKELAPSWEQYQSRRDPIYTVHWIQMCRPIIMWCNSENWRWDNLVVSGVAINQEIRAVSSPAMVIRVVESPIRSPQITESSRVPQFVRCNIPSYLHAPDNNNDNSCYTIFSQRGESKLFTLRVRVPHHIRLWDCQRHCRNENKQVEKQKHGSTGMFNEYMLNPWVTGVYMWVVSPYSY